MTSGRNRLLLYRWSIVVLLFLSTGLLCIAQTTLIGSVRERLSSIPVAGAFIYAYDGSAMTGYALSDGEGNFRISIPIEKTADRITVTCLGYRSETIVLEGRTSGLIVTMSEQPVDIKEAKVTASVIEERGDTLQYTAQAFSDGSERVLGDLLEKIPGITITASGGIQYEGSYINKFYVEGMDLMGGQYGVITRNLSPDVISRVEVYKHHQPVRALIGVRSTDKSAVNIILKESARSTWMVTGDAMLGTPDLPLFDSRMMLTRFSKKNQDLLLVKGNNVGGDILKELTQQQYFGKTGAFLISDENLDADFQTRLNPRRESLALPQEYWYDNTSGMVSLNHLNRIDDDRQLRISLQAAAERYEESAGTVEQINFAEGQSMVISEERSSSDSRYYSSGTLSYENNSARKYVKDDLSFSGQLRNQAGSVIGGNNGGSQSYDLPSMKLSNDFGTTFHTSGKRVLSLDSHTKYVRNSHEGSYVTDRFNARQEFMQNELSSVNSISSIVVFKGVRLNLNGGLDIEYQGLDAELSGIDDPGIRTSSSLGLLSVTPGGALGASFTIGKTGVAVSLPFRLHVVDGKGLDKVMVYPALSPSLSLERSLLRDLKLNVNTSYSISRSGIESLLGSSVMSSYRSVSYSDSLSERRRLISGLALDYSDNYNMFYARLSGMVSLSSGDKMATSLYSDLLTVTGFMNAVPKDNAYGVTGSVSKFFGVRTLVVEIGGGWDRSDRIILLQDSRNSYVTDAFSGSLDLRVNPSRWLAVNGRTEWTRMNVSGARTGSSDAVTATGSLVLSPVKPVSVKVSAHYRYENAPGLAVSNTPLVTAVATWQLKKVALTAECRNLLGCKEFTREFIDEFRTVTNTTRLLGRQYLIGIRLSM